MQFRPEIFLLGCRAKLHDVLFLYITGAKLLFAQRWKDCMIPIMEEWLLKLMELAQTEKLMALARKIIFANFNSNWRPFVDFLHKKEKKNHDMMDLMT